jgi:Rad3-related DNA helicase
MLIDDRFAESRIKQLLPKWWAVDRALANTLKADPAINITV